MPAHRLISAARAAIALALAGAIAGGCSGAPPPPPRPETSSPCDPAHLDACERRMAEALDGGSPDRDLVAAYAAARAARDPADPWAALWRDLAAAGGAKAVVIAEGGARVDPASAKGASVVVAPPLPAPAAITGDELILAMAGALGADLVVRARPSGVAELFPNDPLAAFMAGIRPVVQGGAALAHLDGDAALASRVRAAFDAAGAFRYADAAREAEALAALAGARAPDSEPVARAAYALQVLGSAGLVLDAAPGAAPTEPRSPAPGAPPPTAGSSPYASLIRVLTAKDARRAWEDQGARVLEGVPADRRDEVASLWAPARACASRRAPPMEGVRDLVLGHRLAGALGRDPTAPATAAELPLAEWQKRYLAMLRAVEHTRTVFAHLPVLLAQRGEVPGLSPAGTAGYKRVTELGLAHFAALSALRQAYPTRFRAFSQIAVATSPGLLGDDRLREALVGLVEASVQAEIAAAKDAPALLGAIVTGALAGLSLPPALEQDHFVALAGAVSARLHGDMTTQAGWGVAALYALDAAYRILADQGRSPSAAAAQIARALSARDVPYPGLAALASAAARYAALAAEHRLDGAVLRIEKLSPERRAAREGLRAALAGLGEGAPEEIPGGVLDDVTELCDGLVAVLSTALAPPPAKKGAAPARGAPAACAPRSAVTLDPATRRVLTRLAEVRGRILAHRRYREGDGLWARRVRLVVTLLSDAMDLVLGSDARHPTAFTVSAADADQAVLGALREAGRPALADAAAGAYAIARDLARARDATGIMAREGRNVRRLAGGLFALFRGEAPGGAAHEPAIGVALLDGLAAMGIEGKIGDDLPRALVAFATSFYDAGRDDQAELCLLAATVIAGVTRAPLPAGAMDLADAHHSRLAWAMRFSAEVHRKDRLPDPGVYADGLRRATDDACQAPDVDATIAVMAAIHDFGEGKRREAREALDRVLEKADEQGLGVPRMVYRYEEKTRAEVLTATVDLSFGTGVLRTGTGFQIGIGFRSPGEPESVLTAALAPPDGAKSGDDAARYYVYTAALAAVYHLLDGDADRAVGAARRVVAALSSGIELGSRTLRSDRPAAWGDDAREILMVAAQLTAEAGMPLLAGDLWTLVRQGFSETLDDKGVASLLDDLPLGLAKVEGIWPVIDRAKRSLAVLADPLPCTVARVELGGYEEVGCDAYPAALGLRVADALKKLPRLRRGSEAGPHCAALRSLDAFLAGVDRGMYDPDAFTRAVEDLAADGKPYEAAVLLSRQKHPNHCSAAIVASARRLGRSPLLGPQVRADLLSSALNCAAMTGGPEVAADVLALDDETRRLPDPSRNLRLWLSMADLAARTDRWDLVTKLVERPDFVGRWMGVHPNAAAAALLLDHAVAAIAGRAPDLERTRAYHQLLCETFQAADRAEICALVGALRAERTGPVEERQRTAKEAVKKLVASAAAAPPAPATKRP
jgi:hypothetical protein